IEPEDINVESPLQQAAREGRDEVVQLLVEHGADINGEGHRGREALYSAVWNRNDVVVRLLLTRGADPNYHDGDRETRPNVALSMAMVEKIGPLLLQYGADPATTGLHGETLLSWAERNGPKAVLDILDLERECFDLRGQDRQNLLSWSVENGDSEVMSPLVEAGVEEDCKPSDML
ncbi:ankyrin, partial [Lindgomyces ingoldianus]